MNLSTACCCIGPQNGQPLCPCRMKDVREISGRYVRVEDLGPVSPYVDISNDWPDSWVIEDDNGIPILSDLRKVLKKAPIR